MKKRISGKYWQGCEASLVQGGAEYFDVLEKIIDSAESEIYFQVYIFENDKAGEIITNALIRSAERGVKIYLLIDSFGSQSLSSQWERRIKNSGIQIHYFMPIFSNKLFYFGRRIHQKVVVVDNKKALVGGLNITDEYRGTDTRLPWLSFAVMLTGPVCGNLATICKSVWEHMLYIPRVSSKNYTEPIYPYNKLLVAVRDNDWGRGKNAISKGYKRAIRNADKSIFIVASYFLPGRRVTQLLKKAIKRGVKVKVILGRFSDVGLFQSASRYLYHKLIKNGIEIYEYQKSIVHAKVAVVDGEWSTIGSYDINYISDFNNIELNIDILNGEFNSHFTQILENIIKDDCIHISDAEYVKRNSIFTRIRNYLSYQFMRFLMKILNIFTPKNTKYKME